MLTSATPLFQLTDQQVRYRGNTVLAIGELRIDAGEKVALVGRSGAGKSTLLRLLYEQQRQDIALCPQQLGLVSVLSVFHNIYMGRLHHNSAAYNLLNLVLPQGGELERVNHLCSRLGLADKLKTSVDQLSGGQQQRTAVARALNQSADIFFGDEPVSSIDELQARDVLELILDQHHTAVIALHDRQLALGCFDRIIALRCGEVVLDAHTDTLQASELDKVYRD